MSTTLITGELIPSASDDVLASLTPMVQSVGRIVQTASPASARALLAQLEAAGQTPTTARPLYFDIGGNLYRSTGAKNGSVWVLSKIDEVEHDEKSVTAWTTYTLTSAQEQQLVASTLPARNYRRWITATWSCYGQVQSGVIEVYLKIGGEKVTARIPQDSFGASGSVSTMAEVREGVTPVIVAGVQGAYGTGGKVGVNGNSQYSRLAVRADPISMD